MKGINMKIIFNILFFLLCSNVADCSISGISYINPIKMGAIKSKMAPGEHPCNPFYWYPRNMPEYCIFAKKIRQASSEDPQANDQLPPMISMPPPPLSISPSPIPILRPPIPILPPPPIVAVPPPIIPLGTPTLFPAPPLASMISSYSYSNPDIHPLMAFRPPQSSNSLPYYFPSLQRLPTGFVPGMHGLVTKDGGINIMPFADVYADIFEKHKNKMIRRKLHKILDKYPHSRSYRNLRKYEKYFTDNK